MVPRVTDVREGDIVTVTSADTGRRTLGVDAIVVGVRDETPDARTIMLSWPGDEHYLPGQFVTLRIPSDLTGSVARSYSLSTSPGLDAVPAITVKRTVAGYGSNWLCDNAEAGMTIRLLPPSGLFTPHDWNRDLHLFAAGSGITPIMSIVKSALAQHDSTVTLFYANRDRTSIIFDDQLAALAERYGRRLRIEHWLETERGLPSAQDLLQHCDIAAPDEAFVCGPAPFMDLVENTVRDTGIDRHNLHVERYVSLTGDPFTLEALPDTASSTETATVTVELDGVTHRVECSTATRLLDAMLAGGVDAPYSCREGDCGSCVARLTSGSVAGGDGIALEPEDAADGYILTCQATPDSDEITVDFE